MTPRQRVLTILNGTQPDQVPWFGDLDYLATALIGCQLKPKGFKESAEYIDWHRELGVGFYLQGHFPFKTIIENCKVTEWNNGHNRYRQVETTEGTLRECWTWIHDSFTEGPTEHLIKSTKDIPAYINMQNNTRYEASYDYAHQRLTDIGEMGVLVGYLPKSPFMQLTALDAGIETIMEIFMSDPYALDAAIAAINASHDKAARIAVDSPAEVLMIPENLSSEIVGPTFFERYMKEYQTKWAREIKQTGKFSCIHLDGTLKGLLKQESQVGLSFIEAMTPAPVGDLAVENWADWVGQTDTVLWGGVPGVYFTDMISNEEFDRFIKSVLKVMTTEPHYVLGVADQVPPNGLESRIRRVSQLVDDNGVY